MTRLDATSEPSMEDILASIRKIIAEDPPGSRPALTPSPATANSLQTAAPQPMLRAPERDPFATFTRQNDETPLQSAAPEPYLKTSPQKPVSSDYGNEPFFAPRSATSASSNFDVANSAPSRIEPSFGPMSSTPSPATDMADERVPSTADISVDAQLSDLLGETASVVIATGATPAAPQFGERFGDRMAGRTAASSVSSGSPAAVPMPSTPAAFTAPDARPGFTVSRDGFVAQTNGAAEDAASAAEADPFDFDLGPSPFLAQSEAPAAAPVATPAPAPTGNSLTARMSASSLERIAAPSVAATIAAGASDTPSNSASALVSAVAAPPVDTTPAANAMPAEVAAPSVAATLAPQSFATTPASEPIGRFIPANASVEAPRHIDRDVLEVVTPPADSAQIEVVRVAPESDAQSQSTSQSLSTAVAVHHADGQMRTMEETVAELLRPMLKTWLAENMPRIVERALRRELNEQMMLDKKDAAE